MRNMIRRAFYAAALLAVFAYPGHEILLHVITSVAAQTGALGGIQVSPVTVGGYIPFNAGPQASVISAHGGTVTCTGGGTPTVTDANLTANSVIMFGIKTKGGTPAVPILTTVTAGTSFVITCGGSDTSIYNYIILG